MSTIVTELANRTVERRGLAVLVENVAVGVVLADRNTDVISYLREPHHSVDGWAQSEAAPIEVRIAVETARAFRYAKVC